MYPLITGIDPGSRAADASFRIGDKLISINGNEIHDVLDYKFHSENAKIFSRN
jgi:S1-C subfamily serine protease